LDNTPPTGHRISEFHKWELEKRLDLAPPFQRKPVWSLVNKSYLIDTIIKGLPIPEVYIQVKTDRDGNTKYIVVDGQQRIRAITEYVNGEYPIREEDSTEYGGKYFAELPDGIKTEFWDYSLVSRELKTSKEADVRDIFRRLNKNAVPLNRQELRHAQYGGKFLAVVNAITDDEYWIDNKIVNAAEVRRMNDASFVSEILMALAHGSPDERDEDEIDEFYKANDEKFAKETEVKQKFTRSRSKIDEILGEELRSTRWHYKSEFYSLVLVVSELLDTYHFPPENYGKMKARLTHFSGEVDSYIDNKDSLAKLKFTMPYVQDFAVNTMAQTTHKKQRTERQMVIRKLLIPLLTPKDVKRGFTDEEKRIIWDQSDKICAICKKKVSSFDDYEPDHRDPHSKGGPTIISNGQVTHRTCNRAKKDS